MNTATKLLKNTIYLSISNISRPFISILLVIYISRTLGTMGLGVYTAVLAFTFFFEKFAQLGLQHLIIRDIAIDESQCEIYFNASLLIGVFATVVSLLVLYIILEVMHYSVVINSGIKIISLSLVFFVLTNYIHSFFEGLQRMDFKSIILIVDVIIRVGLGILAIYLGYGILGLMWAIVASRILICLLSFYILSRLGIKATWEPDYSLCFKLFKQTGTFLLISIVTTTYWIIDVVMLSKIKGAVDVGIYSAAHRLTEILKGFSYSYIAAFFPIMASSYSISKAVFKRQSVLSIKYLFIFTFPISVGTSILAGDIIFLIYGEQFSQSIGILQMMIWIICVYPIALIFAKALIVSNNQRFDLLSNIFTMIFNITLNFVLIPRFSFIGAAFASLLSVCFFASMQYYFVSKNLFKIVFLRELMKPFFAGCIMGIFTLIIKNINLFFVIASSACLYIFILFLTKTFVPEEINRFREILIQKTFLQKSSN